MRVAVLGSFDWTDHSAVRRAIKELKASAEPPEAVLLDSEPTDVNVAALRECRCLGIVPVQYHLPGNAGKRIVEMRALRDEVLLRDADRALVFGELAPDRAANLEHHVRTRQLTVERHVATKENP